MKLSFRGSKFLFRFSNYFLKSINTKILGYCTQFFILFFILRELIQPICFWKFFEHYLVHWELFQSKSTYLSVRGCVMAQWLKRTNDFFTHRYLLKKEKRHFFQIKFIPFEAKLKTSLNGSTINHLTEITSHSHSKYLRNAITLFSPFHS